MLNFSRRNFNILLPLMCGLALCSISFGDLDGFALANRVYNRSGKRPRKTLDS